MHERHIKYGKSGIFQPQIVIKMAKQTSRTSSKSSATKKLNSPNPGRPKPTIAKAGYTQTRRRYGNGGELCW